MDITFQTDGGTFNYRVCAMILSGGKILAMHDQRSPYFYLPGGRVAVGETAEEAVLREVEEELHIRAKISRPLWLNQAFFTLSLGIGSMAIFGSYIGKERALMGESVRVAVLDTFVAVTAGLIIFPACFSFGVQPDAGPQLIFITLPNVFVNMAGGRIWGALFFLFMIFASFSTVVAVFQNLLATCEDMFGWNLKKASAINCIFVLITSMPCVLGYNVWDALRIIGGRDVLDSEDFIVSNLLLPIGSLVYLLFCVSKWGWGFDNYLAEANLGEGLKLSSRLKPYFQFVLPVLIIIILVQGLL